MDPRYLNSFIKMMCATIRNQLQYEAACIKVKRVYLSGSLTHEQYQDVLQAMYQSILPVEPMYSGYLKSYIKDVCRSFKNPTQYDEKCEAIKKHYDIGYLTVDQYEKIIEAMSQKYCQFFPDDPRYFKIFIKNKCSSFKNSIEYDEKCDSIISLHEKGLLTDEQCHNVLRAMHLHYCKNYAKYAAADKLFEIQPVDRKFKSNGKGKDKSRCHKRAQLLTNQ